MLSVRQKMKLLGFSAGIFVFYAAFGVLQERIFRGRYGTEVKEDGQVGDVFEFPVAFVAVQCIVYASFAKGVIAVRKTSVNETGQMFYFFIALFCVLASVTANMALKWISYPTQVVAKASKPIPVIILSVLIGKKSYSVQKYFIVLMIVLGVGLFIFKDPGASDQAENSTIGICLIAFSLLMDGMTGAAQDRMRSSKKPSWMNFMYFVNGWSTCILITVMAATGEFRFFFDFCLKNPTVAWHVALAVLVGIGGQVCISLMVSNFGSLPLSLVTTTRKFFTVLISVITFGNSLSIQQWIATVIIFAALLIDSILSKSKKPADDSSSPETESEVVQESRVENRQAINNLGSVNLTLNDKV